MNHNGQQVSLRVYRDVALASFDLLARIVTALPPFSAVLADSESIIATVGVGLRPIALDSGPQGFRRQSAESNACLRQGQFARHCP